MAVAFSRHLLTTGKQRLDIANGYVHIGSVLHVLLHDTGDQLAFLPENAPNTLSSSALRNSWLMT